MKPCSNSPSNPEPLQQTLSKITHQINFKPFQSTFLPHSPFVTLFLSLRKADMLNLAQVFNFFFTSEIMNLLVCNTNTYADVKDANSSDKAWKLPGCIWKEVLKSELKQ